MQALKELKQILTGEGFQFEIKQNPSEIVIEGLEFSLEKDKHNDSLVITYFDDNTQVFYNPFALVIFIKEQL